MPDRKTTVAAALLQEQDRLLICQRNLAGVFPGKWEFPGGKMEADETPEGALRRELGEELSIAAEIGGEIWRTEYQYPGHAPVLLLFFAVRRYVGNIENRVFQQFCWAAPRELPQYDFLEADRLLIEGLAAGKIIVPNCQAAAANHSRSLNRRRSPCS